MMRSNFRKRNIMPNCGYCGSNIIFGGVKAGNQRFCNSKCSGNAYILSVSQTVPPEVLNKQTEEFWRGNCPKCGNAGPLTSINITRCGRRSS